MLFFEAPVPATRRILRLSPERWTAWSVADGRRGVQDLEPTAIGLSDRVVHRAVRACGCRAAPTQHPLHPRRRSRTKRPRLLWPPRTSHAEHRPPGGGRFPIRVRLCRAADLFTVARGDPDRQGSGPPAPHNVLAWAPGLSVAKTA